MVNNATYASSFLFFQYPVDLAVEIFLGSIIQEPVVGKFNASREILLVGIGRVHLARFIGEKFFKRYFIRFGAARNDPFVTNLRIGVNGDEQEIAFRAKRGDLAFGTERFNDGISPRRHRFIVQRLGDIAR